MMHLLLALKMGYREKNIKQLDKKHLNIKSKNEK